MVVQRMAHKIWVGSFSCVRRRPKLARTVDLAKSLWEWKDVSNVLWGIWGHWSKTREARGKTVPEKDERESKKFSFWPKN